MNRAAFYAALHQRTSGVFGTSLSTKQVEGVEAILDEAR
jgi:putative chitinase